MQKHISDSKQHVMFAAMLESKILLQRARTIVGLEMEKLLRL